MSCVPIKLFRRSFFWGFYFRNAVVSKLKKCSSRLKLFRSEQQHENISVSCSVFITWNNKQCWKKGGKEGKNECSPGLPFTSFIDEEISERGRLSWACFPHFSLFLFPSFPSHTVRRVTFLHLLLRDGILYFQCKASGDALKGSDRVKVQFPMGMSARPCSPTSPGMNQSKNVCSNGTLDKNVQQLASAMLTALEGIVPQ